MMLATLCLLAATRTVAVPLAYTPPKDAPAVAAPAGLAPFSLAISDDRGGALPLGTKTRDQDVTTVTTETDLAAFAAEAMAGALRASGATVESGAPFRLEGRLLRADVEEGWGYVARVRVAWTLRDAGGSRWEKTLTGSVKKGSMPPSGEPYSAALSAAAHDLAAQLIAEEAFLAALGAATSTPEPVAAEAPPASVDGLKTPEAMFEEITKLAKVLDPSTLAAWVSKQRLTRALTVDEIVAWRGAGIPNEAVRAAIDLAP